MKKMTRKKKGISLKASPSIQEESDKEIDLDEDDDLSQENKNNRGTLAQNSSPLSQHIHQRN